MNDANKSAGLPKLEAEADWVIDLDQLAEETGTPSALSVVPLPTTERLQPDGLLDSMTGSEFFRLASEPPADLSLTQATDAQQQVSQQQALQQQNDELLDWVSELQESLNQCQSALQFQRQRSQELEAIMAQRQKSESTTSLDANFNRAIQESQQQVQKQKILVETLTQQLDNSKDRVAHLEQEYGSLQKRFADQTQRLVQSENECRALKTRLSRQQRYTLQFKAALERCLEVSVPLPADIDPPEDSKPALPEPVTFFPRSSPVQPWSAQEGSEDTALEGSWHKVTQWVDTHTDQPDVSLADVAAVPASNDLPLVQGDRTMSDPPVADPLDLTIEDLSIEDSSLVQDPPASLTETRPDIMPERIPEGILERIGSEPSLSHPPQDANAQSVNPGAVNPESAKPEFAKSEFAKQPISLPSLEPLNLDVALQAVMNPSTPQSSNSRSSNSPSSNSPVPDPAPYQLWQNLAQTSDKGVAEVSSPETPLAESLSETSLPEETPSPAIVSEAPSPKVKLIAFPRPVIENSVAAVSSPDRVQDSGSQDSVPPPPLDFPSLEVKPTAESSRSAKVAVNPLLDPSPSLNLQPSWPSPLVYPLRPPKKRNSLAAIELPRFPRP